MSTIATNNAFAVLRKRLSASATARRRLWFIAEIPIGARLILFLVTSHAHRQRTGDADIQDSGAIRIRGPCRNQIKVANSLKYIGGIGKEPDSAGISPPSESRPHIRRRIVWTVSACFQPIMPGAHRPLSALVRARVPRRHQRDGRIVRSEG